MRRLSLKSLVIIGDFYDAKVAKNFQVTINTCKAVNFNTTNIKESNASMRNMVQEALIRAVRDVEIVGS